MATPAPDSFHGRTVMIVIVGHLASAPRAQKEAAALRRAGARVVIRGNWFDARLAEEDNAISQQIDVDFAAVTDFRREGGRVADRVRHRIARLGYDWLGHVSPRTLGPGAWELLRAAKAVNADLTVVHSEPGLWLGRKLLDQGQRVGVDFEDWFSHDQLPDDRPTGVRRSLQALERHLLCHAHCCTTTTLAMAHALASDAGTERVPVVVPNSFPADTAAFAQGSADPRDHSATSFYWFSQTIGPARGLETLASAVARLHGNWTLHLRGSLGSHREWFEQTFPAALRERIHCLEPVSNAQLPARTRGHDVGLALEQPYCENKQLTASNKIHEYLRCGLAVIATATEGQREVMHASPGAGLLVDAGDDAGLAAAMQTMIDAPARLASFKEHSARAGRETWDWKVHEPRLLATLLGAMTAGARP